MFFFIFSFFFIILISSSCLLKPLHVLLWVFLSHIITGFLSLFKVFFFLGFFFFFKLLFFFSYSFSLSLYPLTSRHDFYQTRPISAFTLTEFPKFSSRVFFYIIFDSFSWFLFFLTLLKTFVTSFYLTFLVLFSIEDHGLPSIFISSFFNFISLFLSRVLSYSSSPSYFCVSIYLFSVIFQLCKLVGISDFILRKLLVSLMTWNIFNHKI